MGTEFGIKNSLYTIENVYVRNRREEVRIYVAIKYVKISSPRKSK